MELTFKEIDCFQFLNNPAIRYVVESLDVDKQEWHILFEHPKCDFEQRLYNNKWADFRHNNFRFYRGYPFGNSFSEKYLHRKIINLNGLTIHISPTCEALLPYHKDVQLLLNINKHYTVHNSSYKVYSHHETIAALHMHEVEYLIVNHYPIESPLVDNTYNHKNIMQLWVNPTEENAKRVRKANKQTTGNPPKLSEMVSKTRRFLQVDTLWQTFYKDKDFKTIYNRRVILNIEGQTVHVMYPDDC